MRDFQKKRVYDWENQFIRSDKTNLSDLSEAQELVNFIWKDWGLNSPPRVVYLDKRKTTACATANRFEISISEKGINTTVLIHEIAHSMTSTIDDKSAWHGPLFVGMYMKLLNKYLRIPNETLYATATLAGVKFIKEARPVTDKIEIFS